MKKLKASIWPKILLLLVLLAMVIWFGYTIKKNQISNVENESLPEQAIPEANQIDEQVLIFSEKIEDKSEGNGYEIIINYPKINNKSVDNLVMEFINSEKSQIRSTVDMVDQEFISEKYSLQIDYDLFQSNDTESIVFSVYNYTGGAHGNFYYRTFTFDKAGNLLPLTDFIPSQKLPALSDLIIQKLANSLPSDYLENGGMEWVKEGVQPDISSLGNFAVSTDGINFYFPPYQVGPWAMGSQEVKILNTEINKL